MSTSNCGGVERYQGLRAPTCLGGKGCDACREKYRNPPVYSLPWMKLYRADVVLKMQGLAKVLKEPAELQRKRKRLGKLLDQVEKLCIEVHAECPHLIENQKYDEMSREDTNGMRRRGMDYRIQCKGCNEVIARWGD